MFHLALRQTEGLIASIIDLLGLDLAVPDHTTLCRRTKTLEVPRPPRREGEAVHLLVDSSGLKLCGAGEWLLEKHGTKTRRSWRKLYIGMDADTGQIVAAALTTNDVDDGSQVGPLLDQVAAPVASFSAEGAYDQKGVAAAVAERHPEALIIVPPRSTAVPSETAENAPTQRDRHLQCITEHGRAAWQKASGYTTRARVEAAISRFKQVIGDALRCRTDASGNRGGRCRPCSEPHVKVRTPDLRPLRLNPAWAGLTGSVLPIPATRPPMLYARRHHAENRFFRLRDFARIALRRDKTPRSWMGFAHLAATMINLRIAKSGYRP